MLVRFDVGQIKSFIKIIESLQATNRNAEQAGVRLPNMGTVIPFATKSSLKPELKFLIKDQKHVVPRYHSEDQLKVLRDYMKLSIADEKKYSSVVEALLPDSTEEVAAVLFEFKSY